MWPALSTGMGMGVPATLTAAAQSPALAPYTAPAERSLPGWFLGLIAVGLLALVVWTARRAIHPRKLALTRTPGRRNRLDPMQVLLVLALWLGAGWAAEYALEGLLGRNPWELGIAAGLTGQLVWLGAGLALGAYAFRAGLSRGLGLSARHWLHDTVRGLIAYLAVLPVVLGVLEATLYLIPPEHQQRHTLLVALGEVSDVWVWAAVFSAVVMAPLAEEIFFRGLVQSMVRRFVNVPWVAILVSSVLFVLLHFNTPQNLPALLALALVLGYNYERTGRLWPSIVVHGLFNAVFVALELSRR